MRTRNTRLAAIHAFFRFVAISEPAIGLQCQRILAIPTKRCEHGPVEFLTEDEVAALVAAPDPGTWIGSRDRTLLLVATQTGLRNHELTSLKRQDVALGTGAQVRCFGKGRKMRCTPLRPDVVAILKQWLSRQPGEPSAPYTASANLYSLIETCKANGIDPYRYLVGLFRAIPLVKSADDYEALLPWHLTKPAA